MHVKHWLYFSFIETLTSMFGFEIYFFLKLRYLLTMIANTIFIINLTLKLTLSVTILLEPSWLKNIICVLLLSYNQIKVIKWHFQNNICWPLRKSDLTCQERQLMKQLYDLTFVFSRKQGVGSRSISHSNKSLKSKWLFVTTVYDIHIM